MNALRESAYRRGIAIGAEEDEAFSPTQHFARGFFWALGTGTAAMVGAVVIGKISGKKRPRLHSPPLAQAWAEGADDA